MDVETSRVVEALREFSNRYPSLKGAGPWGIAASGGPDSTALVLACHRLGQAAVLLHANYGLRGEESEEDERFVRELGTRLGFPVLVRRFSPRGVGEEELRELRYQWFRAEASASIWTGHTLDDQAETVLHRILRGTGPDGLVGVLPCLGEKVYRPFLDLRRKDLRDFLESAGQTWREDSSNLNLAYRRNWLRNVLLPSAQRHINEESPAALARLAMLARDEQEWLGGLVADLLPHFSRREGAALIVNAAYLREAPKALQRRLLRAIFSLAGVSAGIDFAHVEEVLRLCAQSEGSGRIQLPGLDLLRSFDWLRVARLGNEEHPKSADRNFRQTLEIGRDIPLADHAGFLRATLAPASQYNGEDESLDWDDLEIALAGGNTLELRNWRPGDGYQLRGGEKSVKLKELFQKFRIPLWQRRSWPIVVLRDEPVWARQFGPAAHFAVHASTRRALRIEWFPELGTES